MLTIIGKKSDIERYKKQRGVIELEGIDWDPATGQQIVYDGLKRLGAQGVHPDVLAQMKNNPYIKYGPDFREGFGSLAALDSVEVAHKKSLGGMYLRSLDDKASKRVLDMDRRLEIIGVANANIVDRYDERVNPAGLDASNFMKNRVLLLDHMYWTDMTVGRVQELMPESDGVKFTGFVADPEMVGGWRFLTTNQQIAMSLIAQGLVQTVSIGFIATKIRAPLYNNDGVMEEPAVIEQWELLELSIVAVPANPGSVFQQKALAQSFYKTIQESAPKSHAVLTTDGSAIKNKAIDLADNEGVQTLILSREKFTLDQATQWVDENGYKVNIVDEQPEEYRFEQRPESDFEPETIKRLSVESGVEATVGLLKEDKEAMTDEQAKALIDGVTALGETMKTVATGISDLKGQNEKILGSLGDGKGCDEDEEMEKRLKTLEESVEKQAETLKQVNVILGVVAEKLDLKAA